MKLITHLILDMFPVSVSHSDNYCCSSIEHFTSSVEIQKPNPSSKARIDNTWGWSKNNNNKKNYLNWSNKAKPVGYVFFKINKKKKKKTKCFDSFVFPPKEKDWLGSVFSLDSYFRLCVKHEGPSCLHSIHWNCIKLISVIQCRKWG